MLLIVKKEEKEISQRYNLKVLISQEKVDMEVQIQEE